MVRSKWLVGALFALSVLSAADARSANAQEAAAVGIKSIDGLLGDVKFIAGLVGKSAEIEKMEEQIRRATDGKGLAGIGLDTKKPLGAFVRLPNPKDGQPAVVVALPVTDADAFINFALSKSPRMKIEEAGGLKVVVGAPVPVYLKVVGGYLYGSNEKSVFDGKLPDASTLIPAAQPNTSLALSIRIDGIPQDYKDLAISGVEQFLGQFAGAAPGGAEAFKQMLTQIKDFLRDGKEVALGFEVNPVRELLGLEFSMSAVAGSELAKRISAYAGGKSVFTGMTRGAAGYLLAAANLSKADSDQFDDSFKQLRALVNQDVPEQARKLVETLLDGAQKAVDRSAADAALAAHIGADNKLTLVGGLRLADGKALEDAIKAVINDPMIKGELEREIAIKSDEKHGGVVIHEIRAPREDAGFVRIFGEQVFYVAFARNAALIAVGKDGKAMIKKAIDDAAAPSVPVPVMALVEISVAKLAQLAPDGDRAASALKGIAGGRDKVRAVIRAGDAYRVRFEVDTALLKAFGSLSGN